MNLWQQNYDPAGNIWLSSLIASLPILFFFFALIKLKLKGYVAASWTVAIALAVALLFYKMPVANALASVVYGFFYGLWPIAWIIIAAVFVYKISVKTGQFDIIRSSILSITPDQRLQMLIVGFCFGAFLEGAAGFGAPVAITAALLVGLGFKPLYAAGLCLIVNTAPVAFGAMGIPILVAGQVTGAENIFLGRKAATKEEAIRFAGEQLVKGGYVEPEYVQAMLDREKLTPTYLGESIAVPHGTVEAKDRVLKTGVVFCQYPEGVRFGEEEDDIARLVIGIAARNNEHIQVITSLTNALDDESVIERLAHTTSVDEVLELLAGRK